MVSGCGIMLLNLSHGSTLPWGMGRGLLCLTLLVIMLFSLMGSVTQIKAVLLLSD